MNAKRVIAVLAAQTLLLLFLIARQEYVLAAPSTILLETAPVDPRDLLRGDYVILNYKVSQVPSKYWSTAPAFQPEEGQPVYVSLEKRGEFHEAVLLSPKMPPNMPGQVVIRGRMGKTWNNSQVRVEYGLERYYVKEGTGNPRGKLTVEASVTPDGTPAIKQVFLDGKPYAEAMRQQTTP